MSFGSFCINKWGENVAKWQEIVHLHIQALTKHFMSSDWTFASFMPCNTSTLAEHLQCVRCVSCVSWCSGVLISHWLVPVLLGDSVEGGEYQWQDDLTVLLYQTEDVLVIPEIKSPLRYLRDPECTHKRLDGDLDVDCAMVNSELG